MPGGCGALQLRKTQLFHTLPLRNGRGALPDKPAKARKSTLLDPVGDLWERGVFQSGNVCPAVGHHGCTFLKYVDWTVVGDSRSGVREAACQEGILPE